MTGRTGAQNGDWPAAAADRPRRWADLLPRVLSGLVLVALALLAAWWGGTPFMLFWLAGSIAVLWEWRALVGDARDRTGGALGTIGLIAAAGLLIAGRTVEAIAALALAGSAVAALAPAGRRVAPAAGLAYAGVPVLSMGVLRGSAPDGLTAVLWVFAVVWGTDVMAYFGGRLVGGPKLWRRVSPAKTWSGFAIGVGAGALAGLMVRPAGSPAVPVILVGLAAGAMAQGGDLLESWLKRRRGVKDASRLIPGHGGVMDRLDGFIAAAGFAACLGAARAGLGAAGSGLFVW